MELVLLIVILGGLPVVFGILYFPDLCRLLRNKDPEGGAARGPFILAIAGLMSAVLAGAFGIEDEAQPPPSTGTMERSVQEGGAVQEDPPALDGIALRMTLGDTRSWKIGLAYAYMIFYVVVVFVSIVAVAIADDTKKDARSEVRAIAWAGLGVMIAIGRNTLLS